ncbi:MAG: hypothetical protein ACI30M_04100 [Muribaculaceae bacterium]
MSNLYIFAIGGSGSRVMRSMAMLFASGVEMGFNVIPMIIDPDASNGDMERTVSILRQYEQIHKALIFDNSIKNKFFSPSISSLNDDGIYLLPLNGTAGIAFSKFLNIGTMSLENQSFVRMLFSNANLSSTMDVGFKGNPNIGSVVLNQFTQSKEYETFETNFADGDRVFIISSIFGGTGASGFPLLLKKMRTSEHSALKNAPIGAVSLLPYFNLKTNSDSSIQADSFITKTKAALNYYEKNVTGNGSLDEMYYLGDDFSGYSYDNCEGGDNQKNDAHIIEMLAALSLVDFAKRDLPSSDNHTTTFHEFGLQNTPNEAVIFSDFGNETKKVIQFPLTTMALLNSYLNNRTEEHRVSQKWAKEKGEKLGESFFGSDFFRQYTNFKSFFEEWLSEMSRNIMGFRPFKDDEDIKKTDGLCKVVGVTPKYSGLWPFKKTGYDLIDEKLGKNINSIQDNLSAATTFMELFYTTLSEICSENLNIKK